MHHAPETRPFAESRARGTRQPTLLLVSGGIESTALLHRARSDDAALLLLHIDYGQRNARAERAAMQIQSREHPAQPTLLTIDTPTLGDAFRRDDGWVGHVPLPARNLYLWSVAINVALARNAGRIRIGLNADDRRHGPDALATLDAVRALAALHGAPSGIEIEAPLSDLTKAAILTHPHYRAANWKHAWSCLLGHALHCGQCPQCSARQQAFRSAGVLDPTPYRHPETPYAADATAHPTRNPTEAP